MNSFQPAEHADAAAGVVDFAFPLDDGRQPRFGSMPSAFARGGIVHPHKVAEATGRALLNGPEWLAQDVIDGITEEHTVDGYTFAREGAAAAAHGGAQVHPGRARLAMARSGRHRLLLPTRRRRRRAPAGRRLDAWRVALPG